MKKLLLLGSLLCSLFTFAAGAQCLIPEISGIVLSPTPITIQPNTMFIDSSSHNKYTTKESIGVPNGNTLIDLQGATPGYYSEPYGSILQSSDGMIGIRVLISGEVPCYN